MPIGLIPLGGSGLHNIDIKKTIIINIYKSCFPEDHTLSQATPALLVYIFTKFKNLPFVRGIICFLYTHDIYRFSFW